MQQWSFRRPFAGKHGVSKRLKSLYNRSSPNNIRAATAKGIALRELGKNEEALRFFDRALNFNAINSFVYYNKALALRNLGRLKESDDCIKIVNSPRGGKKI